MVMPDPNALCPICNQPAPNFTEMMRHVWCDHCGGVQDFCWCERDRWKPSRNHGWMLNDFIEHIEENGGLELHLAECVLTGTTISTRGQP